MKVETKKAIDTAQAVTTSAAATMGGALGAAGTSTFASLLNTFTATDMNQAAFKPANFASSKKTVTSAVMTSNAKATKANTAKDTSNQYDKTAAKANAASTPSPSKAGNKESNESNENDTDADNAAKTAIKTTAAQDTKASQAAQTADQAQPPVKMEDVMAKLNLNEQQVQQLAQTLNMSVDDLKQMQIAIKTDAQTGAPQLTGIMADGKEKNLSAMLGMNAADGKAASAQVVMDKIAGILNLDTTQKQDFFAQLNISSISSNDTKTLKNADAAKQADQTQPSSIKDAPTSLELGKIAVQDAAQSGTNGNSNGGNSFNGEAGVQLATTAQKGDAVADQTQKIDFSAALSKAGEAVVANAAQGVKIDATQATAQTPVVAELAKPDAKVMNQIVEKASILQFPNSTQTKISLNPKELGNVDIKLTMHDASVTASIVVENHAVKQVVEANLAQLKHALHQQGITVDEMQVTVNQQNKDNSQNSNHSQQEAAAATPFVGTAPKTVEPVTVGAPFMRRPIGNHRVSVTA